MLYKRYRKRPIVVDVYSVADVLEAASGNWEDMPEGIKEAYEEGNIVFTDDAAYVSVDEHTARKATLDDFFAVGPGIPVSVFTEEFLDTVYERIEETEE